MWSQHNENARGWECSRAVLWVGKKGAFGPITGKFTEGVRHLLTKGIPALYFKNQYFPVYINV